MAGTAALQFGRNAWVEIADRNGIRKQRPAVIVTPTERITPTDSLTVVAATSRVPDVLPEVHVLLPWHPQRHPRTGLNRKCAAVCSWLSEMTVNDDSEMAFPKDRQDERNRVLLARILWANPNRLVK